MDNRADIKKMQGIIRKMQSTKKAVGEARASWPNDDFMQQTLDVIVKSCDVAILAARNVLTKMGYWPGMEEVDSKSSKTEEIQND